ncbi:MAG TPA: translocation/assembly module TamB domain-containing protein, partial [Vicinamibacterales bacterium]|nr:translocation/assembly module TamB domain-containing protein [Vicinamibacterales bacterium]
ERVVAIQRVDVTYDAFRLISDGITLDGIRLIQPKLRLARDGEGWNLGRLVRERGPADRPDEPGRPFSLRLIEVTGGSLDIDDPERTGPYRLPGRIDDLEVRAAFESGPAHYTVDLDRVSFRATSPSLTLEELSGRIAVRDNDLSLERVAIRTSETAVSVDGVVEDFWTMPVFRLASTGKISMPEIARVVPAAEGYELHPSLDVKANGPLERLALDLFVRSEAGKVRGQVTADLDRPELGFEGRLTLEQLDLAPILQDAEQRSDVTGDARFNLVLATVPEDAGALDGLSGTFRFTGPRVVAARYEARDVRVTGSLGGGRIVLDARANAYGGTATASGFIAPAAPGRPLALDLEGGAGGLDLRNLPPQVGAPRLATDLSIVRYRIHGTGGALTGTAAFNRSMIEGATIADGTVAEFSLDRGGISYAARGGIADLNLQRLGAALDIDAIDRPEYETSLNSRFDVAGSGTDLERMTLSASGTLNDSSMMGARVSGMTFDAHIERGALAAKLKGTFADVDPARAGGQPRLAGRMAGDVDASVAIADLTQPLTPDSVTADGQVLLRDSKVAGLEIDRAVVDVEYSARTGLVRQLEIAGPALSVSAAGRLALDRTSTSNLSYRIDAADLASLGRLVGQEELSGSVSLEGMVTGNATSLETSGSLKGDTVGYQGNSALDLTSQYTVTVPEFTLSDARVEADTRAALVRAGNLEIRELTARSTYAANRLDVTTEISQESRTLEATGQVTFHQDHQEIHIPALAMRTDEQEWRLAPGTEATVQYRGDRVAVQNLRLVSGDQSVEVAGELPLKGEEPAGDVQVRAANVDLARLERLLLQDRGLSGRLSAQATVSGTAERPLVDGRVEVVGGGFRSYRYESLVADVDYRGDRIELDATLRQSPSESVTASGTVPMTLFARGEGSHVAPEGADTIDVRITSTDIGLGMIQSLTTQVVNVAGTLRADVRVTGSGQDPHLEGHIDIRDGAFAVPAGGVSYTGLDTRIDLQPDVLRIQKFQIRDEHGAPLTVSGQLAVHARQAGAVDLTIESDDFEVIDNQLGDVGIGSKLRITGELRRPRIEGDLRLEAARLEVDRILQLFYDPYRVDDPPPVVSADRAIDAAGGAVQATRDALARAGAAPADPAAEPPVIEGAATGPLAPVALDVRLVIPDNLVLRGDNLRTSATGAAIGDINITVGGDLRIRKDAGGPLTLTGAVNTIRGTYEFQGRRFDLVRGGTLRFTGDFNPLLDVAATRRIPDTGVEARIQVRGTA